MHLLETQGKGCDCWKLGARENQSGYDTRSPVHCISGVIVGAKQVIVGSNSRVRRYYQTKINDLH